MLLGLMFTWCLLRSHFGVEVLGFGVGTLDGGIFAPEFLLLGIWIDLSVFCTWWFVGLV